MSEMELSHFGVKGMRWGVRKDEPGVVQRYRDIKKTPTYTGTVKTKTGLEVLITETPPSMLDAALGAISPKARERLKNNTWVNVTHNGKFVGEASFRRKSKDEIHLDWLSVPISQRGKGFGSAIFNAGVKYAKDNGYSKLTLEVPDYSPDARHIYEKQGFVSKEHLWGVAAKMELDLNKASVLTHSAVVLDDLESVILETFGNKTEFETVMNTLERMYNQMQPQNSVSQSELMHYGKKGMRWGQRRAQIANAARTVRNTVNGPSDRTRYLSSPKKLSDKELLRRIGRMQNETKYIELNRNSVQRGANTAGSILASAGKTALTTAVSAVAIWGIKKGIEKKFGSHTMLDIFPKKKK